MEQRLGFANAADGTRIGYSISGDTGQPLLATVPPAYSHAVHWYRAFPWWRDFLVPGRRFVWVDHRGSGTSDRAIEDYSLDALADDVEAVAGRLGLETIDIIASGTRAPVAIHLAARRPGLVRRMVLHQPTLADLGWHSGTRPLRAGAFDTYLSLMASRLAPDDQVGSLVTYMKLCVGQQDLVRAMDAFMTYGIAADLPRVECPVLMLPLAMTAFDPVQSCAEAAAIMPNAQVVALESIRDPSANRHAAELAAQFLDDRRPAGDASDSPVGSIAAARDLSGREREVLSLLASGRTNREIAQALVVSEATVATHVRHILEKTGTANRAEATAHAVRNGLA